MPLDAVDAFAVTLKQLFDRGVVPARAGLDEDVVRYIGAALPALVALSLSRPALEDYLRTRVRDLPNVDIRGGYEATGLLATADRLFPTRSATVSPD
jgi:hypothetical protein